MPRRFLNIRDATPVMTSYEYDADMMSNSGRMLYHRNQPDAGRNAKGAEMVREILVAVLITYILLAELHYPMSFIGTL
jgi:hypothetical protein